ncbi:MAG: hypothetical protein JW807_10935 [Spirochaetes bacterium]|nr:hypothetical protein [Spirochaetota bacterium]
MNVKSLIPSIIIPLLLIINCAQIKNDDIIGRWIPVLDSTKIIKYSLVTIKITKQPIFTFYKDGTFAFENIPDALLIGPYDDMKNTISGGGKWSIGEYQGNDVVYLKNIINKKNNMLYSTETYINIQKSLFNNRIILFFWIYEAGSEQYSLLKRNNINTYYCKNQVCFCI